MFNCTITFNWKSVKNGTKGTFRGLTSRIMFTANSRNTFARAFNGHVFPMTREIHLIGMALGVIAFTYSNCDNFKNENNGISLTLKTNKKEITLVEALRQAVTWIKGHGNSKYINKSSADTNKENSAESETITEVIGNFSNSDDDKEENGKKLVKISAKQINKLLRALGNISNNGIKEHLAKLECTITIPTSEQSTKQAQNDKQNDGDLISSASFESNASNQTKKAQKSQHKRSSSSIDDSDINQDDDEDDLDAIKIPEIHDNNDWEEGLRRINDIKIHELTPPSNVDWDKKIKELNEHLTSANARIIEMRRISEENQEELRRLQEENLRLRQENTALSLKRRAMEKRK